MHSTCRGHKIVRRKDGVWVYADTGDRCWGEKDRRPCKRCGRVPTPEGYDACLGKLQSVIAACCGHGIKPGWITKTGFKKGSKPRKIDIAYITAYDKKPQISAFSA